MIYRELKQHKKEINIMLLTLLLWILIVSINDNFGSVDFIINLFSYNGVYFVCALGVLPLMIMRGIDLSVGGIMLATSVLISLILSYMNLPMSIILIVSIVFGMVLGMLNGQVISRLKVSSVIMTLAMLSIYKGVSKFWFRQNPSGRTMVSTADFKFENIMGMPIQNWMILLIILITFYLLKYHPIGRAIYAFGGNPELAERMKFSQHKTTVFVYAYSGLIAGLAAFMHMTLLGQTNIEAYNGIEFELIIILIMGGLNILGGYGTVLGTFFATAFIVILNSGMVFVKIPAFWQDMLIGGIIIVMISYDMIKWQITLKKMMGQGEL